MSDPVSTEPSPELLHRAQSGDESAFAEIFRDHYERTFRLIFAILRNESDARDVAQEAWVTIWKQLPKFRGESRFSTWLHPIATRRALDHLRKRRRWFDRFLPIGGPSENDGNGAGAVAVAEPASEEDGRDQAERSERSEQLHRALDALPPQQRAILALRELEGLSYEEIARTVDIPVGTVMSRLHHARRHLADKLGKTKRDA